MKDVTKINLSSDEYLIRWLGVSIHYKTPQVNLGGWVDSFLSVLKEKEVYYSTKTSIYVLESSWIVAIQSLHQEVTNKYLPIQSGENDH